MLTLSLLAALALPLQDGVFLEAEEMTDLGGWTIDTQFIESMGSPYLIAHGLGRPVAPANATIELPAPGTYRVWVRTFDWVARWKAPGTPGRFRVAIDGEELKAELGTLGEDWLWQDAGVFEAKASTIELTLLDQTGFDGRCDAIYLTHDPGVQPPSTTDALAEWRWAVRGQPEPIEAGRYDLVVVGGGVSGTAAAISAARMGCRVALLQNRPVLGGNGSSEIRVWMKGGTRRGLYPRLGEIVDELSDVAKASPGMLEEFVDQKKEAIVRAEDNIDLFLLHHVTDAESEGGRLHSVVAIDIRGGQRLRFRAPLFVDSTGHGVLGALAGADHTVREKDHMGMSNMWRWVNAPTEQDFPRVPWALDLEMDDFPYPKQFHAQWFWEGGFDQHPIDDLEAIRDWNLRAVFGAFDAMKNKGGKEEHRNARLTWLAVIGGNRESRQLLGDLILTRDDIVSKRPFPDGCVPTTWSIDLHVPNEKYSGEYLNIAPFISRAIFDEVVDRENGYPVPYRCLYSRNLENLFMAGRCVSVTHEALGTVRVMKTGGMMGEVVGKAASLCRKHEVLPKAIYEDHFEELKTLMRLPGGSRRKTVHDEIEIAESPSWSAEGVPETRGIPIEQLGGIVVDNHRARLVGDWKTSTYEKGFVGTEYLHDDKTGKGEKTATFVVRVQKTGRYRIAMSYRPSPSRDRSVPVTFQTRIAKVQTQVDQTVAPELPGGFHELGEVDLAAGRSVQVVIGTEGTTGHVIVDAVQAILVEGGSR
ncbi:MAG: FAD-dependent oxidoreductase [Planctomycetota bacterium]